MKYETKIIIGIILVLLVIFLFWILFTIHINYEYPTLEECTEYIRVNGHGSWDCATEPTKCLMTCNEFGVTYSRHKEYFLGSNCWCNHDGVPLQVY